MKLAFIVNPISGKRLRGRERIEKVQAFVSEGKLDARVCPTECAGHATELARKALARGAKRVVAVGGDGTINEVGRELVGREQEFGIVALGSGNGLARHVGLPLNFMKALELAAFGTSIEVDTGEANGHPFFNVMGIGFDAEVGRRFNETRRRGFANYLKQGLAALREFRSIDCSIGSGRDSRSLSAYIIAVANSSQYGSNAYIAPDASMLDGKLNLVAISRPGPISFFVLLCRMFSKKLYYSPRVTPICSESFTVKLSHEGFFHVDGEIFQCGRSLDIRACPRSLKLVALSC